jgi:hypothetical protein
LFGGLLLGDEGLCQIEYHGRNFASLPQCSFLEQKFNQADFLGDLLGKRAALATVAAPPANP